MKNLLERAKKFGTPLIDGNLVTFVWEGEPPLPLRGDFNDWFEHLNPWVQVDETLYISQIELPSNAYVEYCFGPDEARVADPFNRRKRQNGMGHFNNYMTMPECVSVNPERRGRGVPAGEVIQADIPTCTWLTGKTRRIWFYQPPTDQPVPLLVVLDGIDYLNGIRLPVILDNLIAQKKIAPIAVAMVADGKGARLAEYSCSEATVSFIRYEVFKYARGLLNLSDTGHGIMGISLGGLMAIFTALRMPETFTRVLSQSGTFHLGGYPSVLKDMLPLFRRDNLKIWLDAGDFDPMRESNVMMYRDMQALGYDVTYQEFSGGHNHTGWRNHLRHGLEFLYPPQP